MTDQELEEMMNEIDAASGVKPASVKEQPAQTCEPMVEEKIEERVEKKVEEKVTAAPQKEESVSASTSKDKNYEVGLNSFIDGDRLREDVAIDITDLDSAMVSHPSMYVYYATQTVNARRQYDRIKHAVEILEAKLDAEYRATLADEGKKVTENMVKNALVADKRWASAQAKLIDAHGIWKLCDVAENAFMQRKDLILEIARDRRKEKEGSMRVLEEQERRQAAMAVVGGRG